MAPGARSVQPGPLAAARRRGHSASTCSSVATAGMRVRATQAAPCGVQAASKYVVDPVRVGVIGTGHVSGEYFQSCADYPELNVIAELNMGNSVYSTPIVANNILYIGNRTHLFAIENTEEKAAE